MEKAAKQLIDISHLALLSATERPGDRSGPSVLLMQNALGEWRPHARDGITLSRAAAHLGAAAYPEAVPLTLTILTRPGTLWREWETFWKKSLTAVGLRVEFRELPAQDQFKEMEAGHFQMVIRGWGGSPLGYVALAQLQGTQVPGVNPSRFSMSEYDQLNGCSGSTSAGQQPAKAHYEVARKVADARAG